MKFSSFGSSINVPNLVNEVFVQRESLQGLTFADAPDAFKNLESLKVRLAVAKNPNHFTEKYAQWFAARAARRAN